MDNKIKILLWIKLFRWPLGPHGLSFLHASSHRTFRHVGCSYPRSYNGLFCPNVSSSIYDCILFQKFWPLQNHIRHILFCRVKYLPIDIFGVHGHGTRQKVLQGL